MAFNRAFGCLRPVIAGAGGRVVKVEADSLMLAFPDAVAACRAVESMERTLRELNDGLPLDERVAFSYGVGFGTLLDLGDDLFGLEVNLASKLGEDLGRPGEVLLTPSAVAALPAALRRRLVRYATVRFSGAPLPVRRLRVSRASRSRRA
jgi:class 3 adenylate cyclase